MDEPLRRGLRLALVLPAFLVSAWLFHRSAWVVDHVVRGERDSLPLVYVLYGAPTWVPAIALGVWGIRTLALRGR